MLRAIAIGLTLFIATPAPAETPADAPKLTFAFEETVTLGTGMSPGKTMLGTRNIVPITGGTFEGPGIRGTLVPGGWDWQLQRADGCWGVRADYMLKTDDGAIINVLNQGALCPPENGVSKPVRTVALFEPPLGRYQWLGQSAMVGTLEILSDRPAVRIRFYRAE
ncbi:DUF3237 domain-containing protein [Asticcacaulis solisilvae]|uniref:DUF3237 domain-containing protein n=1 Tax=Asticcacaulis solisilvae TaxID=1217274 RepID=UPI003FD86010